MFTLSVLVFASIFFLQISQILVDFAKLNTFIIFVKKAFAKINTH